MSLKSLILVAVLFLAARPALAQQPHPALDPVAANLFAPELIMQHQKAIGLDEGQKGFIRSEIAKAQVRFTELQWQMQDTMESLVALLGQNAPDEQQVMAQLDKVLDREREIKRAQLVLMVRLKGKLTSDQQAQLRQLRDKPAGN
jgi:Spy/CpxP family protein refolding chaperone